jgi:hypothetical protein
MASRTIFRCVDQETGKFRYYPNLDRVVHEFSSEEIKRQSVSVVFNGVVVGEISDKFIEEANSIKNR